jgi:WD40 repeat protein
MLVVALESGVYICKVNEDCNDVLEIKSNSKDPENPFYHVLWNMEGNSVVCAKLTGEVQMCDLKHQTCRIQWQMETKQFLKSVALERDCLLTCGTEGHGVSIYDVRLNGAERIQPIWRLRTKKDPRMSVNSLSWSPNGHTLACGSQSGLIHLWDIRQPAKEMRIHDAQKGNPVQVIIFVNFNFLFHFSECLLHKVLNWCQWKPSILVSGSGYPRPSICLYSNQFFCLFKWVIGRH